MRRLALMATLLGLAATPALAQPIAPTNPVAASTPPAMSTRPSPAQMASPPAVAPSMQPISPVLPTTAQSCNCLPTTQTAPAPARRAVYRRHIYRRAPATTQASVGTLPPVDIFPRTYSTGVYAYAPQARPVSSADTAGLGQFLPGNGPTFSGQDDYITDGVMGGSAGLGGPGPNNIGW